MKAVIVGHAPIRSANRTVYRKLAASGVDVCVVVPSSWKSAFGSLEPEPESDASGIRVVARPRRGLSHSNCYWLAGSLDDVLERGERGAVYADEDPAGFAAAQAARAARRAGYGFVLLGIQNISKRYPPPFSALQRCAFRTARAAVATTEQASRVLRSRGFDGPTIVMPFATDLAPLAPHLRAQIRSRLSAGACSADDPLVGFVGRLVDEKGVDVLLRALAQLDGVRCVVVGDGPQRARLEMLASRLGIAGRTYFLGALAPSDAARTIGALDVMVLPSRTTRTWSEQFGRVLIEAMACGARVVASKSGAIPEVVGDAGLLVAEDDVDGFARAIAGMLDRGAANRWARKGLERVAKRYSTDAAAAALHQALALAAGSPAC